MVRKNSSDDKITFDQPIEQPMLVPWKQLASPTVSPNSSKKGTKTFDFLDHFPARPRSSQISARTSTASRTAEGEPTLDELSAVEEDSSSDEGSSVNVQEAPPLPQPKTSREASPMQEKLLLEQKWQTNLIKIDGLLSDISAPHRGVFGEQLFNSTFKSKEILSLLFQLFDWDNLGTVPQDKIVDCSRKTFQSLGGIEWVELLEVVAYVICQENDVTEQCFIRIFKSKGVVEKLFRYITRLKGKDETPISRQQIMDLIANLTYSRPRTGFSAENVDRLETMFRDALGDKQELTFEDFKKIVLSKNSFFAERVFHIFDRDKSGSVSLSEFVDAMHQFTGKSPNDKIKFMFRVYDLDGDGFIQRSELEQVMQACMEENGMKFSQEQIQDLTHALFEDADTEGRGEITYEALKAQLEKHPALLENLSISIDRWLVPPQPSIEKRTFLDKVRHLWPYQCTMPYLRNNYVYLCFLSFFIAVNLGLFIDRAMTIAGEGGNVLYVLARASGQCLNFNCSFILILVLRQSITFLRTHGASSFLPLDQHLYFHKMCGWVILFHSLLHTIMHLINFPLNVASSEPGGFSAEEWLLSDLPATFGLVEGWANPTGIILIVVLLIMVICSLPFVRKSGYFEVFYWTHLLYLVFWTLTLLHGPHFWKWFVGPAVLFTIEKVYRTVQVKTGHGKTYISSGILLPSRVTHLVIQKPHGFHYHPGDYIFVKIPAIARYEWHPLTISSAPEQEGAIWVHIRAVGEWTNRLYTYFENQQRECGKKGTKISISYSNEKNIMINMDDVKVEAKLRGALTDHDDGSVAVRKNGTVNVSYESEAGDGFAPPEGKMETLFPPEEGVSNRKKLGKTKSVPDLGGNVDNRERNLMMQENRRNNSVSLVLGAKAADEVYETVSGQRVTKLVFPTNRSAAMSFRYIRRKPPVLTLDVPELVNSADNSEDDTNTEEEEDQQTDARHDDEEAPTSTRFGNRESCRQSRKMSRRKSRQESQKAKRISRLKEAESIGECTNGEPLALYVDGPYGAPSSHIFRAQHAVLIGTGIGVTPFASILQSIMHRYLKVRQTCPQCEYKWTADIPSTVMNLRKVDFFWINRDQRSFEWFVNLLSQLEIEQAEQGGAMDRFLDMHMYITSALQKTDMKAVGLQLALDLLHEKEKRDLITGLKTRTNAGRPNWDKVFKQLTNQKKGKITVFYCGPPALGRTLRYKCDEYGFDFRKEIF